MKEIERDKFSENVLKITQWLTKLTALESVNGYNTKLDQLRKWEKEVDLDVSLEQLLMWTFESIEGCKLPSC